MAVHEQSLHVRMRTGPVPQGQLPHSGGQTVSVMPQPHDRYGFGGKNLSLSHTYLTSRPTVSVHHLSDLTFRCYLAKL